jgi:ubiquinone/menaquinone biosynthesis C-methylase UbiE
LNQGFGLDACGIEYDRKAAESVQSDDVLKNRVFQGDLQMLNYSNDEWDYAMLNEVLEHVADEARVLREIHRVLKPNGIVFVFSPNRWFPFETHGVDLKTTGRRIHWLPFIPYMPLKLGEHFYDCWARNYWQSQLKKMLEKHGFAIMERSYIWPTFENLSGNQPRFFKFLRPLFRFISNTAEKTPIIKRFGVTQVSVCRKIPSH